MKTKYTKVKSMIQKILSIIAIVVFVLAAINVSIGTVSLVPLGLAFFASSFIFDE